MKRSPPHYSQKKLSSEQIELRKWAAFIAMIFGMFMAILDIQIVASSLNEIGAGLAATTDEISWVQTSYLIAEVIMIPLTGFFSRLLSTRTLFIISVLGFSLMSFLCAFAWDINSMIISRALQGFIGGAMIPTVFASIYLMFPPEKRTVVTIAVGLVATMAPTLGPTFGGYLTDTFSWHWLFLINVVPGIVVAYSVWKLLDIDKPDYSLLKGFDFIGLVLLAFCLGSLEFVLEEGNRKDWFNSAIITNFTVVTVVSGILFFLRAYTYDKPIVDFRAYKTLNFSVGTIFSFILGVGLYGAVFLLPLFLSQARGYNSLQIGKIMFVTGAFQFMASPVSGLLTRVLDLRFVLFIGICFFCTGVYLHSFMTADSSFWELFLPQVFRGIALMFCFIPINMLALGTLPADQLKSASGLYNLSRNLGGAIGLSILNTMLSQRTTFHFQRISENFTNGRQIVQDQLSAYSEKLDPLFTGNADAASFKIATAFMQKQALIMALNDCFYLIFLVFAFSLPLIALFQKPIHSPTAGH
jgi:DHA2 family multidrug resistance protein